MIKASDFGSNFVFGASTSAPQTEGAISVNGKGLSIWDDFARKRGKIKGDESLDRGTDFYRRYKEDISLMSELGMEHFRFSISWPRIFPNGKGKYSSKGIGFYDQLIDELLAKGITPWVTLYHWDLPLALEKNGGWTNRETLRRFFDYTSLVAEKFKDRVRHWMVLNEPMAFTGAGYFLGVHAPGKRGVSNFLPSVLHASLAIGEGSHLLRSIDANFTIGSTYSFSALEPKDNSTLNQQAYNRADALMNRLFLEPNLGLGFPLKELPVLNQLEKHMALGDEKRLKADLDFIGVQNYTREVIKYSFFTPFVKAGIVEASEREVPLSAMGWEIHPKSLYNVLTALSKYEEIPPLIITENGLALEDELVNGKVWDIDRIVYLQRSLEWCIQAVQENVDLKGYFVWSLTDNFEWAEGYRPRFGLIHIDYATMKRTIKESGYFFRDFLQS